MKSATKRPIHALTGTLATFLALSGLAVSGCGSPGVEGDGDDVVLSTQSEPLMYTNWSGYLPASTPVKDVAVASRGTDLLDLFWVGNGTVRYRRYTRASGWVADVDLGRPSTTALKTVAAVASGSRLDVFAVGVDRRIWHKYSDRAAVPTFSAWVNDIPVLTDTGQGQIGVASWTGGRFDVFWWKDCSTLGHAWFHNYAFAGQESGSSSKPWFKTARGSGAGCGDISAVSRDYGIIDLFYADLLGTDLFHHYYDGNQWGTLTAPHRESFGLWYTDLPIDNRVVKARGVVATSSGPNNLEVFPLGRYDGGNGPLGVFHTAYNGQWALLDPNAASRKLLVEAVEHSETVAPTDLRAVQTWWSLGPRIDLFGHDLYGSSSTTKRIWQAFRQ